MLFFWQSLLNLDLNRVIRLSDAALEPTILIITCYVAYQQWRINKTRLDLDLYDRRLAIYKAVEEFFDESLTQGKITFPMEGKLRTATAEARFLFPHQIQTHLEELSRKAKRAAVLRNEVYPSDGDGLVGQAGDKALNEERALITDIQEHLRNESRRLFGKYLTLA